MSTNRLHLIHINLETKKAVVEFVRMGEDGLPEPGKPRHTIDVSDELIALAVKECQALLDADLAPLERVRSVHLTSELHKVREARDELKGVQREQAEGMKRYNEHAQAIEAQLATGQAELRRVDEELQKRRKP